MESIKDVIDESKYKMLEELAGIMHDPVSRYRFLIGDHEKAEQLCQLLESVYQSLFEEQGGEKTEAEICGWEDSKTTISKTVQLLDHIFDRNTKTFNIWKFTWKFIPHENNSHSFLETVSLKKTSLLGICKTYFNYAESKSAKSIILFKNYSPECYRWLVEFANDSDENIENILTSCEYMERRFLICILDTIAELFPDPLLKWRSMAPPVTLTTMTIPDFQHSDSLKKIRHLYNKIFADLHKTHKLSSAKFINHLDAETANDNMQRSIPALQHIARWIKNRQIIAVPNTDSEKVKAYKTCENIIDLAQISLFRFEQYRIHDACRAINTDYLNALYDYLTNVEEC